jgi:hypothetical protein
MTARRKDKEGTDARLEEAKKTAEVVAAQGDQVDRTLSLVGKLTEGWRKVHEKNHLAQLFHREGHIG